MCFVDVTCCLDEVSSDFECAFKYILVITVEEVRRDDKLDQTVHESLKLVCIPN